MAFRCPVCNERRTIVRITKRDSEDHAGFRTKYVKRRIWCHVCNVHFWDTEESTHRLAPKRHSG